jgi:outer membrane protein assembly factor BamB
MRWTRHLILVAALIAVSSSPASALTLLHPACTDVAPTRTAVIGHAIPALDWKENLAVGDDGTLWVTSPSRNKLYHLSPTGTALATLSAPGAGGMAFGPDGRLYVGVNKGVFAFAAPGGASVLRLDPAAAQPQLETFAAGLDTINGLAVGSDGSVYLTSETGAMRRIAPDGTADAAWSQRAGLTGSNGLGFRDGTLYTSMTLTADSQIISLPVDQPESHHTIAKLSGLTPTSALLPKGLDDLTFGPDNTLYTAAFVTGEILRVDIATGASCAVSKGFLLPTSIRPIPGSHGSYYVTEAAGRVFRLDIS